MSDLKILWIWHRPNDTVDLDAIKLAKMELEVEYKVVPRDLTEYSFMNEWELDERVLAIGTRPPWIVDYFLVAENGSSQDWMNALSWVLGETEDDWEATSVIDILTALLPGPVRQLSDQEITDQKRLSDYQNRRD